MKKTIRRNSIPSLLLIPLMLACFAFLHTARAVVPPPDGGYSGGNTAEGTSALFGLTTGIDNTAIGFHALNSNTTGNDNTALGFAALHVNIRGLANTALGFEALYSNRNGGPNTATGAFALHQNTDGANNVATGYNALYSNTSGNNNTATGLDALLNNTTGSENTATGFLALFNNYANDNTADGSRALYSNGGGHDNTAVGFEALFSNTSGALGDDAQENTAIGSEALYSEQTSHDNTAVGSHAMYNYDGGFRLPGFDGHNTAIGSYALYNLNSAGIWNIALGADAGLNIGGGVYNIDIGNPGDGGDYNTIRIGTPPQLQSGYDSGQSRTFIAGIRGVKTDSDDAIPVVIDSAGQLGTMSSSARFKTEIKPMDNASEAILELKPVTFHYKSHKSNNTGAPQFGLIAEEVAKVNPDLVVRDAEGKVYTVRYDAVNAMLLNEFLKEHRKVEAQERKMQEQEATIGQLKSTVAKQEATIAQQQKGMEAVVAQLKDQASQIQKVSAQVEANKPAPQMAVNDQ